MSKIRIVEWDDEYNLLEWELNDVLLSVGTARALLMKLSSLSWNDACVIYHWDIFSFWKLDKLYVICIWYIYS